MSEHTVKDIKLLAGLAVRQVYTLSVCKMARLFVIPVLPLRAKIKAEESLLRKYANCMERYKAVKEGEK